MFDTMLASMLASTGLGLVYAVLVGVPLVAATSRVLRVTATTSLAVLQDVLPLLLVFAWVGLAVALWRRDGAVSVVAGLLCVYHVALVIRLALRSRTPRWVRHAQSVTIAVANVYIDNEADHASAQQLIEYGADVVMVAESTRHYRKAFDGEGGRHRYPHRVYDAHDTSDYAVALYCAREPSAMAMADVGGELRAATAHVTIGGAVLQVVGVNPMAAVDPGGYPVWRRQVRALGAWVAERREPIAVVGDLNTTVHRAAFDELARAGLRDAHDVLGQAWRPSFKLAARGPLARLGPMVRLDHALCNRWVWPLRVHDLASAGSDHRPFVVTLAVRAPRARRRDQHAARRHGAMVEHRTG